jgi:hypothetical protein
MYNGNALRRVGRGEAETDKVEREDSARMARLARS